MTQQENVLAEIRTVLRGLPGLNPDEYPSEQDENPVICLVYPGPGRAALGSSHGGNGYPNYWTFDTILIDVFVLRSDLLMDYKAVEPYAQGVITALMAAFSRDRFNGQVVAMGDPGTPGSGVPIRRSPLFPQSGGIDGLGHRFEVDVSYQVDILHD
jgi:hypothetical protein